MNNSVYVVKASEYGLEPTENCERTFKVKRWTLCLTLAFILASLLVTSGGLDIVLNIFTVLLLGATAFTFTLKTSNRVETPFEIRFYGDSFEIYREKRWYKPTLIRMEIDRFKYSDVSEIVYNKTIHRYTIKGKFKYEFYNYSKDGTVSEKPSRQAESESLVNIYKPNNGDCDLIKEFESHLPIKVRVTEARSTK